jgi:hypothetical protein
MRFMDHILHFQKILKELIDESINLRWYKVDGEKMMKETTV